MMMMDDDDEGEARQQRRTSSSSSSYKIFVVVGCWFCFGVSEHSLTTRSLNPKTKTYFFLQAHHRLAHQYGMQSIKYITHLLDHNWNTTRVWYNYCTHLTNKQNVCSTQQRSLYKLAAVVDFMRVDFVDFVDFRTV